MNQPKFDLTLLDFHYFSPIKNKGEEETKAIFSDGAGATRTLSYEQMFDLRQQILEFPDRQKFSAFLTQLKRGMNAIMDADLRAQKPGSGEAGPA
jgi:hypothetical protein